MSSQGDPFKTLFVGRLSYDVTDKRLRREFEEYGAVKSVSIVHNIKSGSQSESCMHLSLCGAVHVSNLQKGTSQRCRLQQLCCRLLPDCEGTACCPASALSQALHVCVTAPCSQCAVRRCGRLCTLRHMPTHLALRRCCCCYSSPPPACTVTR